MWHFVKSIKVHCHLIAMMPFSIIGLCFLISPLNSISLISFLTNLFSCLSWSSLWPNSTHIYHCTILQPILFIPPLHMCKPLQSSSSHHILNDSIAQPAPRLLISFPTLKSYPHISLTICMSALSVHWMFATFIVHVSLPYTTTYALYMFPFDFQD